MDLKSGYPFWLLKDGLPFNYESLSANKNIDVVIMGGGISGALVAWQLIKNGIECMVVDGRTIGLGSTCASTALLQYEIDTPLCRLQQLVGVKHASRAYQLCLESITALTAVAKETAFNHIQPRQSLYYAAYKKDVDFLKEEYAIRKENGFNVSLLDSDSIKKGFGFDAPAAILSKDAAQTDAYLFTHQLLQKGIAKGLQVYDRTLIANIQHQKNTVVLKTDKGVTIKAKKMVYATGYEVVKYIDKPIVKLHSTYACVSEHSNNNHAFSGNDALIWNTANPYLYMRTTTDNRIVVGGRDEKFYNPARREKLIKSKAAQLSEDFKKLFPSVAFDVEFSWCGTFGATKDGLPFIGTYKKLPNSYFALGFGGNGITFSQVAAVIIADLIKGRQNSDASIFSFDR